jgi:HK97 gp10 family phage protein
LADQNLTGFKELAESLKQLGPRVAKNTLRRAVSAGAVTVRNEARARAPVDTGEMKKDIQVKREKDQRDGPLAARYSVFVRSGKKSRLSGKSRNIQKNSFYWKFIELGTSKMAAQPFLVPAFESRKEEAVKIIGEKIDEGIQKAARELANR